MFSTTLMPDACFCLPAAQPLPQSLNSWKIQFRNYCAFVHGHDILRKESNLSNSNTTLFSMERISYSVQILLYNILLVLAKLSYLREVNAMIVVCWFLIKSPWKRGNTVYPSKRSTLSQQQNLLLLFLAANKDETKCRSISPIIPGAMQIHSCCPPPKETQANFVGVVSKSSGEIRNRCAPVRNIELARRDHHDHESSW